MLMKFFGAAVLGLLVVASSAFADEAPPLSQGETVYAPVYSDVQYGNLDGSGNPSPRHNWQPSRANSITKRNNYYGYHQPSN